MRRFSCYEAYPVVFLYQHALELSLKYAIYKAAESRGYSGISEVDDRLYNTHNLRDLAKAVRASLSLLFPNDSFLQELLARLTTTTQELAGIDPTSYVYRYPMDTTGRPASQATQSVNVRAFAQHMSALLVDVDTLNFGLNATTDIAQDAFTEAFRNGLAEYP
jgi:hypothetical protein